jgi:S-adenosylmethionine/arginine decarboxylase-like enzyme
MRNGGELTVNIQKTKYLCIGAEAENLVMESNKEVRTYREYKYLDITLNREGTDDQKISITKIE